MRRFTGAVVTGALLAGCGTALFPTPIGVPANPAAEMRPDLIMVEPVQVAPGDVVALTFPEGTTRGILFVLDRDTPGGWQSQFHLTSDGPGQGWERTWSPVSEDGLAVEDIGVGGPGPDRVLIPDITEPGAYRICTGNAAEVICVPIEVVAP